MIKVCSKCGEDMDKICKKCKKVYDAEYLQKNKDRIRKVKTEYNSKNKEARKIKSKIYRTNNAQKLKESREKYLLNNKEKELERGKKYYSDNKDKCKIVYTKYKKDNKDKIKNSNAVYFTLNKEKIYDRLKKDRVNRPYIYVWRRVLRGVLERFGKKKEGRTIDLLGYSATDLKNHIENQFKDGMSWSNYGEWEIDHIREICTFDKDTPMNIINSLDNLQPLWREENWNKWLDLKRKLNEHGISCQA